MKKKLLLLILSILLVLSLGLFVSCGTTDNGNNPQTTEQYAVYELYSSYTTALGETPLTYEQWLESIRGEDGVDGKDGIDGTDGVDGIDGVDGQTPYIGENGNWWIGDVDTEIKAEGADGKNGLDGLSIKSAEIVDGELILTLTDDSKINCGKVVVDNTQQEPVENLSYVINKEKTGYIVMGRGTVSTRDIIIPDTYKSLPVTEIGEDAFLDDTTIDSISMGNNITTIGEAFGSYNSLDSVYYTGTIDDWAMIEFGGYYSNPLEYAKHLYLYNETSQEYEEVTNVNLTTTYISDYAFSGWNSLQSVTIGDSVESIGYSAFSSCRGLQSITIPDSVKSIGNGAFYDCTGLTEIKYNSTACADLSYDYNCVFYNAGQSASGITVTIGANVTKIPAYLFYSADSLPKITNVVFENNSVCESIGEDAFFGCRNLTSITIPDSVKSIGSYAFSNCDSLESITVNENNEYYKSIDGNLYTKDGKTLLQYAIGKTDTQFVIGNSVESIGNSAFYYCISLQNVYYSGTKEEWDSITIESYNTSLINAIRYYYSADKPTDTENKYWRYVDGVPTPWVIE